MNFKLLIKTACLAGMVCVLAAVTYMSLESRPGMHPDEACHLGAGRYYIQYWDPPRVGDERTLGAYSNYGISYLQQLDVVYFLAGKFARLILPLVHQDYVALRLFNVCLLAGLFILFWRLPDRSKLAFAPLLVSPQIWYIFSYFNADAFPLFAAFLVVYLAAKTVGPRPTPMSQDLSMPQDLRWLGSGNSRAVALGDIRQGSWESAACGEHAPDQTQGGRAWPVLGLGLALGLVAVSKQNYYVFLGYFFGFVFLAVWLGKLEKGFWRQVLLAVLLAGLIFAGRYAVNISLDQGQPPDAAAHQAEKMASEEFKPSKQATGQGFWGLNMRAQGVSFPRMFTGEWKWHVFTFRSAVGKYGGMEVEAPLLYYRHMGWLLAGFGLVLAWLMLRSGQEGVAQLGLWLLFGGLTVFQSVWHSWTADFQAQGRYLFPFMAMTGCVLGRFAGRRPVADALLWALGAWLMGMSLWSYLFVGLRTMAV